METESFEDLREKLKQGNIEMVKAMAELVLSSKYDAFVPLGGNAMDDYAE